MFFLPVDISVWGLTSVHGIPYDKDSSSRLFNRVGFCRNTHYGVNFEVMFKEDPSNVAYTNGTLGLHTDLPYYEYTPGVIFMLLFLAFPKNV